MKQRITAVLTAVLLAALLCACSDQAGREEAAQEKAEEAAQEMIEQGTVEEDAKPKAKALKAAVLFDSLEESKTSAIAACLRKDMEAIGVSLTEYEADGDAEMQLMQASSALKSGADLLLAELVHEGYSNEAEAICQAAAEKNVPVIFFYREIELRSEQGVVLDHYKNAAFVGPSSRAAGRVQGEMVGNYVKDHYDAMDLNHDGVISYAMFKGDNLSEKADLRTRNCISNAEKILSEEGYLGLTYFEGDNPYDYQLDLTGRWSALSVREYMQTNLTLYTEKGDSMIELVICNSDDMAVGAVEALNDAGYNLGDGESVTIPVFGIDGTFAARQLIQEGKMTGTAACDAGRLSKRIRDLVEPLTYGEALAQDLESNRIIIHYDRILAPEDSGDE